MRYVLGNAQLLFGSDIPVYMLNASGSDRQQATEKQFFEELLYMLGYQFPSSGTIVVKRRRVVGYMVEQAHLKHEHRILLFIDEAQCLSRKQYGYLIALHNLIQDSEARLIVVLVGQPEMIEIKAGYSSSKQGQVVGRFMVGVHHFSGVTGFKDVDRIFRSLDDGSEFPSGSGISYTQHFVPVAYASGWRMRNQAKRFWSVLRKVCTKIGYSKIHEIQMQPISALIRVIFIELAEIDSPDLELTDLILEELIERVALLQLESHFYETR